ncbi:MAG: hypothetical protein Q7T55_14015, partial [Solirubrobacteraceae bacterium]|nr:hypothetical protein [Solirubrobacteraceae bacterium]
AGPGAIDDVIASWESAVASSPGEVALLVTDDWMPKADVARLRATLPDAVVVRTRVPSGGPPRLWPVTALAIATALTHFDFEYLVKFDTDALATGPGWVAGIQAAIGREQGQPPVSAATDRKAQLQHSAEPGGGAPIGIAGAFVDRPDGEVEIDAPYHRRVLEGELPRDATLADWHRRALAGGWPHGEIVQGGCLVLTRACCQAIADEGALTYRPRLRTIVSEDLLLTVLAYALGFRAASLGSDRGPLAVANKHLPVPLEETVDPASRWLVAHSVRLGLGGEPEAEVRAAAAAARTHW